MRALLVVAMLAACGQDRIDVQPASADADYNHHEMIAAVDKFVAAGRTPAAYAELARTIASLRPGMDRAVAEESELKLIVLALAPIRAVQALPRQQQIDTLALTVWPTLLAEPVRADALLSVRDPRAHEFPPKPGETAAQYLERLCGGALAADCKRVVPEDQGEVVAALATRRATERARNAVADCMKCDSDPGWHQAVLDWESLDRAAAQSVPAVVRRSDPDNWPVSGAAAEDDPGLPEAELTTRGDIVVDGHSYGPNQQRIDVLRDLRGSGELIALHLHPDMSLAQVRGVLRDAQKAGIPRAAVIARESIYPWRRHVYWIADGSGMRANLRPTDSLQLLLHAIDEVAGPGTVARVD